MDCFREEHGVRKWKRLWGLKLKRKEEGGEKEEGHGDSCGFRVRRGRILSSGSGVGYEREVPRPLDVVEVPCVREMWECLLTFDSRIF